MTEETWANLAYVAGLLALAWFLWWLLWDPRPTKKQRAEAMAKLASLGPLAGPGLAADDGHEVGPDALRLLEDLDKHLNTFVAYSPDLNAAYGVGSSTGEGDL